MLADLHSPTLYILGGPTDIAYANGMDDFARIAHVPVAVANINTGHGGTYWEPKAAPPRKWSCIGSIGACAATRRLRARSWSEVRAVCRYAWTFETKGFDTLH